MKKQHQSCPDCGSSDGLTDYGDHTYCFVCNTRKKKEELENQSIENFTANKPQELLDVHLFQSLKPIDLTKCRPLVSRSISEATAKFYNVQVDEAGDHVYPFFDLDCKKHVANQFRSVATKGFRVQGDWGKTALFGQQLFPASSAKQITITEGVLDALSVYQMSGSQWPVVAVKSASSARKDVADNFEYLNSFDKIVICFDKDREHTKPDGSVYFPGQEAAQKVAAMFPLGKVRVLTLKDAKDANDYLMAGWSEKFQKEWWKAPEYTPQGIKFGKDLWEQVQEQKNYETVLYPWDGLNAMTYGMRLSEVVLITADTGVGKSSVVKEIEHHLLQNTSRGVGLIHLEECNGDTILSLMSITANRPLHLPNVREQVKDDELKKYFDSTCSDDRIVVWDHFGSNSVESVLKTIHHMHALGCKYIILDHLSIVVSDQSGDERKQLDEISTKLKTLCMELNCCIICIIHINRRGEVRGSAGPEQIANIVIRLIRDKLAEDEITRNTTKVVVEKNRFSGKTGPACLLYYDSETGRLQELPREDMIAALNKDSDKKETISKDW